MMPITGGMPNIEATPVVDLAGKQGASFEKALQQSGFEVTVNAAVGVDCNNVTTGKTDISQATNVPRDIKLLQSDLFVQVKVGAADVKVKHSQSAAENCPLKMPDLVTSSTAQEAVSNTEVPIEILPPDATLLATPVTQQIPTPPPTSQPSDDAAAPDVKLPQRIGIEKQLPVGHEVTASHKTSAIEDVDKDNIPVKKLITNNLDALVSPDKSIETAKVVDLPTASFQAQTISLPNVDKEKANTDGAPVISGSKPKLRSREYTSATNPAAPAEEKAATSTVGIFVLPDETSAPTKPTAEATSAEDTNLRKPSETLSSGAAIAVTQVSAEPLTPSITSGRSSFVGEVPSLSPASLAATSDVRHDAYGNGAFDHEPGRLTYGTMTTSTTSLEVGVAGGTHGWLRVRAELENGVVTASLASPSAAGREALHRELPSLANYLREGQVGIGAVVVRDTSAAERRDTLGSSNFSGQGQHGQTQEQNRNRGSGPATAWGLLEEEASHQVWRSLGTDAMLPSSFAGSSGGWLNVRV
jgi:hypothetical protein